MKKSILLTLITVILIIITCFEWYINRYLYVDWGFNLMVIVDFMFVFSIIIIRTIEVKLNE